MSSRVAGCHGSTDPDPMSRGGYSLSPGTVIEGVYLSGREGILLCHRAGWPKRGRSWAEDDTDN